MQVHVYILYTFFLLFFVINTYQTYVKLLALLCKSTSNINVCPYAGGMIPPFALSSPYAAHVDLFLHLINLRPGVLHWRLVLRKMGKNQT